MLFTPIRVPPSPESPKDCLPPSWIKAVSEASLMETAPALSCRATRNARASSLLNTAARDSEVVSELLQVGLGSRGELVDGRRSLCHTYMLAY